jgi:hypothetical protein
MKYNADKKEIILDRELSELDKFVIDFCSLLDNYVIVSGYVSILFGRSRSTEDVDLLVPRLTKEEFAIAWKRIHDNGFWCINTPNFDDAFQMLKEHTIRFAKKDPVPNMEFKMIKKELDQFSYDNKIKTILNSKELFISPLETQIAYKLFLGSEKDIEDARHLYRLFKDKLNKQELADSFVQLNVTNKIKFLEDEKH